jgi:hypothetical protein
MDKIVAEVFERPFYVVTASYYGAYVPQYGGDALEIFKNIGLEVGEDAWDWIKYYWNNR